MKITIERTSNYTCVSNAYLRDLNLSLKAKGLLTIILSLPPEWDFSIEGIVVIVKEGRDAIQATINELIKKGYCNRKQTNNKGVFSPFEYMFYESIPQQDIPSAVKPAAVIPSAVNPIQLSTDLLNKEKRNKKEKIKIEAEGYITEFSTSKKNENETPQQQSIFEDEYLNHLNTIDLSYYNQVENTNTYSTEENSLNKE
jgi:hypothetical protein